MLSDIARANRWFGGRHSVRSGLAWLLGPHDRGTTLSLLDVGTGAGDLPLDAIRWATGRGITLRTFGVERIPAAARLAQDNGVATMLACASALPVADQSVDIVLVSQLAHHLDDAGIARLFSECSRIARRGVIISDLRPSRLAEVAFRIGGTLLAMHRTTVNDGVTSLRRGFSTERLAGLVRNDAHARTYLTTQPIARILACWRTDQ
ncbi:MAG: methyltransferase domain-containing protein [Gemmatimonadota bacterium]